LDGVAAMRQAGSTLKPFLYGLALERRLLTAASVLDDSPLRLGTRAGLYVPQNYERHYLGKVSLRTALGSSLNVPAVRTAQLVGIDAFHDRLLALGLNSLTQPADYPIFLSYPVGMSNGWEVGRSGGA
jgi:penicillin-binding protein 1C